MYTYVFLYTYMHTYLHTSYSTSYAVRGFSVGSDFGGRWATSGVGIDSQRPTALAVYRTMTLRTRLTTRAANKD